MLERLLVSRVVCRELVLPLAWGSVAARQWSHSQPGGEGPLTTWLALHGWLDNAASFDRLAPLLVSRCPNLSLICLDYPGHGLSSHLPSGQMYHFLESVRYTHSILSHLALPRVGLIGHSLGAAKASLFAATFPDMVESLVMIDLIKPISRKTKDVVQKTRQSIAQHSALEQKIVGGGDKVYKSEQDALDKLLQAARRDHGEGSITEESGRIMLSRGLKSTQEGFVFSRDLRQMSVFSLYGLSQEVLEQFAKNIKCPHLLVKASDSHSYEDPAVLQNFLDIYRSNPSFEMVTVKGSHHLHLNTPERVLPPLLNFIKRLENIDLID